jgi:hypothetical protein
MAPNRLIVTLLAVVAVVIIAAAVYLYINFSTLSMTQGIVLIAIALVVLLVSLATIIIFVRTAINKK